jgi:hypothetical protein
MNNTDRFSKKPGQKSAEKGQCIVDHTCFGGTNRYNSLVTGGMNLYNNGFAGGLTAAFIVAVIQWYRSNKEEF